MSDKGTTLVSRLLVDLETVFDEVSSTLGEKDDVATVPSDTTSVVSIIKEIYNEVATIAQGTSLFAKSAPDTMEIDDSGTYSLELYDIGDAIPVSAEITAGNYQIDRVRNGALTNIVASTGASKGDGRIYASEDFTAVAGWAVGDIVLVTFSGGSILTGGVTTILPNAYFYTRITRGESIETKVDTVITDTEKLYDVSFGVSPVDGSLASFIATGGTALGTRLPASKSLYDVIVLDRLDNGTYGLSAIETLVDEVESNIGNFQGQTNLQTLLASLGIPDTLNKPLYTCVITDRLDHASYGLSALNTDLDAIIVETDKLTGGEYTGTVSAGTAAETTLKEITTSTRVEIKSIWLDLTLLVTADATIKLYHKIDGTNYKVFEVDAWALTDDDGVLVTGFAINNDFKITITGGEAAGVNIPYNIIYQVME